jgi:hypothetical protein
MITYEYTTKKFAEFNQAIQHLHNGLNFATNQGDMHILDKCAILQNYLKKEPVGDPKNMLTVYRSLKRYEGIEKFFTKGNEVEFDRFTSTSREVINEALVPGGRHHDVQFIIETFSGRDISSVSKVIKIYTFIKTFSS